MKPRSSASHYRRTAPGPAVGDVVEVQYRNPSVCCLPRKLGRLAKAVKDIEEVGIGLLLEADSRIYSWGVNQTFATIDSKPLGSVEAAAWWEAHGKLSKLIVSSDDSGVIG
jgi:hypothetical protein